MKTIERMLLQIFDRKRWIEDQLRQQLDSYSQSIAFNLMAGGVMPPPWVLAPISDGVDCSVPDGNDSPLLKSQYHLRSSYATEKEVGFVQPSSSHQANCSSSLMKVDHHVCENARLEIRTSDSQENTNYGTSTKERAELESSNCGSIAKRQHLPELEPVVECHYLPNAGVLEVPVLITESPSEEILQLNKYAECSSITKKEVGFSKSCSSHLENRASNLTKEDLYACGNTWPKMKTKPLPEFSNCKSILKSQNLPELEPVVECCHPSTVGVSEFSVVTESPSEEMLQAKKVVGNSSVTEKEAGFVKSSSYHQANYPSNFMEVDPHECETTWPLRRKRENQEDTIYCTVTKKGAKPIPDFSICKSIVKSQLPEPDSVGQCHHLSHVEVSKFSVVATESPSEEMLLDKKNGGRSYIPEKVMGSVKSNSSHQATCSTSLMNVDPHMCEITWPKRRKRDNQTDTIYGTTTRKRAEPLPEFCNCKSVMKSQLFLETDPVIECHHSSKITEIPSEEMFQQGNHISTRNTEVYEQMEELNSISPKHQSSGNLDFLSDIKNCPDHGISDHACFSQGQRDTGDIVYSGFNLGNSSCRSSDCLFFEKFDEDVAPDPMPEYERFIPGDSASGGDIVSNGLDCFDSALDQDCVNEETCSFRKILSPLLNSSTKHRIQNLPDCYHSSLGRLFDQFNYNTYRLSSSDSDCVGTCEDAKLTDVSRNRGIEFEGSSLRRPKSLGKYDATFPLACDVWRTFTPPIKKNYQRINLEMGGVSCDGLISNPALTCFRIDENTSTHEEGLHLDEFVAEETDPVSKQLEATSRKPLADMTSFYQNAPTMASTSEKFPDRGSLDSVSTEACFGLLERASQISDNTYGSSLKSKTKNKENGTLSSARCRAKNANKARQNRSSKQKVSLKVNAQHKNVAAEKVHNSSNIVSGLSSFIPLLQQKQQTAALANGKRDIKVKSLEAAEVAKRLEEKKAKERKMKKEAIRLERLRMEKENAKQFELEQKQKEEKKKKEAEIEARKRQREEDDKKERQRKRRCIEEMQQKKLLEDKVNAEKKDIRNRAMEQKKKEVNKDIIVQKNSTKMLEVADSRSLLEMKSLGAMDFGVKSQLPSDGYNLKKVDIPDLKEKEVCHKNFAVKERRESQSYEISPYRDSDDEDEEDPRQKRKLVPLWARRESVDRILDFHKLTDPLKIFSRKKSCSLDAMLSIPIRVRRLPFAPQ